MLNKQEKQARSAARALIKALIKLESYNGPVDEIIEDAEFIMDWEEFKSYQPRIRGVFDAVKEYYIPDLDVEL